MRYGDAQVPRIIIAAHGPRTIEVAGEVADGVLLQVGVHPGSVEVARQHLEAGARRAGRNPEDIEMILCATTTIMNNQQEAREAARPLCVQRLVEKSHYPYLRAAGIEVDGLEVPVEELAKLYPGTFPMPRTGSGPRSCAPSCPGKPWRKCATPSDSSARRNTAPGNFKKAQANGIDHLYLMTSETYQFPRRETGRVPGRHFPIAATVRAAAERRDRRQARG